MKVKSLKPVVGVAVVMASMSAGTAHAQVPPDIEAGLQKIGQIVDPACTSKLYRPLMPANDINSTVTPLYPGISIAREVSFGPNPKDVVDIFSADKGGGSRAVLIYVPGGAGNKIEQQAVEANAFYDNIMRWATKNGMVGVNMQRHPGQGNWDDGGKDVSLMIQWLQANVSRYKGNPDRMFIWAHSAGNGPLGTYIGRPELYGPKGVGVKGAIFMSGQFNIAPLQPQGAGGRGGAGGPAGRQGGGAPAGGGAGSACGASAAAGGARGGQPPAGGPGGPGGAARGGRGPVDPETQLARSSLPALKTTKVKVFLATAELDPGISGAMSAFNQTLHDELCKDGPDHCPTLLFAKGESHMSEVFSIDTADTIVSGPILAWMKKVK
jgi:triacylglycerol lipase